MRRVGVKRAYPESSPYDQREVHHKPPQRKRAKLSAGHQPGSRGIFGRAFNWCYSKMSMLFNKMFSRTRAEDVDEEGSDSETSSLASCNEETQESLRPASRVISSALSSSAPPVPRTSVGGSTLDSASVTKSSRSTGSKATSPTRSKTVKSSNRKPPSSGSKATTPHRYTSRPLSKDRRPILTKPPSLSSTATQTPSATFTSHPSTRKSPFSSTPFKTSQKIPRTTVKPSAVHTISHTQREEGLKKKSPTTRESFPPLLRDIFNTSVPAASTPIAGEKPVEKRFEQLQVPESLGPMSSAMRVPRKSKSVVDSSKITELQEWLKDLRMTKRDASRDRQAEVELVENRLRVCRAERMEIENSRVTRLRSLLQSPQAPEPTPAGLTFDLSQEQLNRVAMALRSGSSAECLSNGFNISITRSDLGSLVGLNWLNDNVVNFYFNLIRAAHPKVHVMSSFFYPKLSQSGYSSVRRWTKKVDIFAQELVLFPIHLGMHWCLAAADFRDSTLSYYDSLAGDNHACLTRLKKYLEDESLNKKGTRYDLSSWELRICKDIPMQENGSDCGVFMCMYAHHLAKGLPFNFSQEEAPRIRQAMICEILEQKLLE